MLYSHNSKRANGFPANVILAGRAIVPWLQLWTKSIKASERLDDDDDNGLDGMTMNNVPSY
jgi:hypothetical protein